MPVDSAKPPCTFCGSEVDPDYGYQRIDGWERKREQGGANVIHLRKPLPVFACTICIDRLRRGVSPEQGSFL